MDRWILKHKLKMLLAYTCIYIGCLCLASLAVFGVCLYLNILWHDVLILTTGVSIVLLWEYFRVKYRKEDYE